MLSVSSNQNVSWSPTTAMRKTATPQPRPPSSGVDGGSALRASTSTSALPPSLGGVKYAEHYEKLARMVQPVPSSSGSATALRHTISSGSLLSAHGSQHGSQGEPLNPMVSKSLQDGAWRRLDTPPEVARRGLEPLISAPASSIFGEGPPGPGLRRRPSMGAMSAGSNGSSTSYSELPLRPDSGPAAPPPLLARRPSLGVPALSHRAFSPTASPRGGQHTNRRRSTGDVELERPMASARRSSVSAQAQAHAQQITLLTQRIAALETSLKLSEKRNEKLQGDMDVAHGNFWRMSGQVRELEKKLRMLTRNDPKPAEKPKDRGGQAGAAQGPSYMRAKKLAAFGHARTANSGQPWLYTDEARKWHDRYVQCREGYVHSAKINAVLLKAVRAAARVPDVTDPELLRLLKQLSIEPGDVSLGDGGTSYEGYNDALLLPEPVAQAAQMAEVLERNAYLESRVAELESELRDANDRFGQQMSRATQLEGQVQFFKRGVLQLGSRKLREALGLEEEEQKQERPAGLMLSLPTDELGAGGEHRVNAMQDAIDRISASITEMSAAIDAEERANDKGRREVVGLLQGILRTAVNRDVALLHAPEAQMERIPALGAKGRSITIRIPKQSGPPP